MTGVQTCALPILNKSPYKIEISADNYETYNEEVDYITSDAVVKNVSLKLQNRLRQDIDGKIYKALKPETGSNSRLINII